MLCNSLSITRSVSERFRASLRSLSTSSSTSSTFSETSSTSSSISSSSRFRFWVPSSTRCAAAAMPPMRSASITFPVHCSTIERRLTFVVLGRDVPVADGVNGGVGPVHPVEEADTLEVGKGHAPAEDRNERQDDGVGEQGDRAETAQDHRQHIDEPQESQDP